MLNEKKNILMLIIASFEANVGVRGVAAVYQELVNKQNDIIKLIEMHSLAMIVARLRAQSLGMTVVNTNYQFDLGNKVCDVVQTAASMLRKHITSYTLSNLNCSTNPCFAQNTDKDEWLLADRVSENGKILLETILGETKYAWMLSLQTNEWPSPEDNPYYSIDPMNFIDSTHGGMIQKQQLDLQKASALARCMPS
jgi:hypothetical protein